GPRGPQSRRCQLSSFDARQFSPHGQDVNTSGHPVSWSPVRPVHTTRPMTQTTIWVAVHLLTAYNFGGLDRDERRLLVQGWHSAGPGLLATGDTSRAKPEALMRTPRPGSRWSRARLDRHGRYAAYVDSEMWFQRRERWYAQWLQRYGSEPACLVCERP